MGRVALTPLQRHKDRWKGGCGNIICQGAGRICLVRGTVPCDVLFIGEAPGESENVLGVPFAGPAGKLLDRLIQRGFAEANPPLTRAFTNLVGCIPRNPDGDKATEPDRDEIKACQPRLVEMVRLCRPRAIVNVGALAKRHVYGQAMFDPVNWLPRNQEFILFADITHPAAILRAPVVNQGLMAQRVISILSGLVIDLQKGT